MSKQSEQRIEAILEAFDSSVDLGDFQYEARAQFEAALKTDGDLDFLDQPAPLSDADALKARYEYLRLGGSWDMLTTKARATYIAGFEDAMKTLGVEP